jgi:hypothetical protein
MSKLPQEHKFLDLSDYGRPLAIKIASLFIHTRFTPVHMTLLFVIAGLVAIYCILNGYYVAAFFFLILKSILDAADGELARLKETPSYTGRYLDSVSDIILNFIITLSVWHITNTSIIWAFIMFFGLQLQGTLYNYYYVILRNKCFGDTTSRIFEINTPKALGNESQKHVNILFGIYTILYGGFDKIIYYLDPKAYEARPFPSWFMTMLSVYGLGFQLLLIGLLLILGLKGLIIPFFISLTALLFVFIAIRRLILN